MKLDVGAGMKAHDGYLRVDIAGQPDVRCDARHLPFREGAFEEVQLEHVLEHIPREYLIPVMNEAHRVLKPKGKVRIEVPVFPFWTAIADPTHVSFFVSQTFDYFTEDHQGIGDYKVLYGIKTWRNKSSVRLCNGEILGVEMEKVAS